MFQDLEEEEGNLVKRLQRCKKL